MINANSPVAAYIGLVTNVLSRWQAPFPTPSPWMASRATEADQWPGGCPHTGPQPDGITWPLVAPLWSGAVFCQTCLRAALPPAGSKADRTCDRCGHVCATAFGDLIYPVSWLTRPRLGGPLLLLTGLCVTCQSLEPKPTPRQTAN